MLETLIIMVVKIGVVFGVLLLVAAYMTWIERKVIADIQVRWGPTRVGPFGLLQPIADGIKLFFKEDLIPSQVDRFLFLLAPALSVVPAMIAFAVIPFGGTTTLFGLLPRPVALQITDIDVGVLYVFGITSLGVYGIVLAGWSSNNKYSLLGGLRSSAQMISYELSMGLSVVGVLILAGSLRLSEIVHAQAGVSWWLGVIPLPKWFVFAQPLRVLHLLHLRPGGDEPGALRPAGGGDGAGGGLPQRVQLHEVRDVLHGGVRQHGDGRRPWRRRCSWAGRWARSAPRPSGSSGRCSCCSSSSSGSGPRCPGSDTTSS